MARPLRFLSDSMAAPAKDTPMTENVIDMKAPAPSPHPCISDVELAWLDAAQHNPILMTVDPTTGIHLGKAVDEIKRLRAWLEFQADTIRKLIEDDPNNALAAFGLMSPGGASTVAEAPEVIPTDESPPESPQEPVAASKRGRGRAKRVGE